MYMGEYSHTIDSKGRVIVPTKLREALGDGFVVTTGLEGCLYVYGKDEWENLVEEIRNMDVEPEERTAETARKKRIFTRLFFSGADTPEPDKQGRILIPSKLREHAALTKDILFIGALNHVEIWDKARWDAMSETDIDELVTDLGGIGFML